MLKCYVRSKDNLSFNFSVFHTIPLWFPFPFVHFKLKRNCNGRSCMISRHGGLRKFLYIAFPKVNTQCNKNNARRKANVPFSKRVKWQWQNLLSFSAPQLTQPAVRWSIDGYMPYAICHIYTIRTSAALLISPHFPGECRCQKCQALSGFLRPNATMDAA